jgi:hypothetical protein
MEQTTKIAVPVLNRIRERGYWRVVIRPGSFERERIPFPTLYPLLAERVVRLRDWDFPQLEPYGEHERGLDWIAHGSERYGLYLEYWRFYQSGQFVDFEGMAEDWRDTSVLGPAPTDWEPGRYLGVLDTLYHFTEIFEFASRLALADAFSGDARVHVEILLSGLRGRELYSDNWPRTPIRVSGSPAHIEELPYAADLPRDELVADASRLALQQAEELFRRFQWEPTPGVLQRAQDEFLRK